MMNENEIKDLLENETGYTVEDIYEDTEWGVQCYRAELDSGDEYVIFTEDNAITAAHNMNKGIFDNVNECAEFAKRNLDCDCIDSQWAYEFFNDMVDYGEDEDKEFLDSLGIDTENPDADDVRTFFENTYGGNDWMNTLPLRAFDIDAMCDYIEDYDGHGALASYSGEGIYLGSGYEAFRVR